MCVFIYCVVTSNVYFFQLRAAHTLTSKLKREIILGSSSLDDPPQFITVSSLCCY
jgi:syntaxin-binding protein 1